MSINKKLFLNMLTCTADLWQENKDMLSDIDSQFGDGDHGVTIGKIAKVTKEAVNESEKKSIKELIEELGDSILGISGGSAGPLYGTLVAGFAEPLGNENEIDASLLKKMFQGSLSEMQLITKAQVGDKTMMDALIPAVEAAVNCDGDIEEILSVAAKAAKNGADSTEQIASKFGRARSYGDKTIGTPDAGAISTSLFFQGLYEGFGSQ